MDFLLNYINYKVQKYTKYDIQRKISDNNTNGSSLECERRLVNNNLVKKKNFLCIGIFLFNVIKRCS